MVLDGCWMLFQGVGWMLDAFGGCWMGVGWVLDKARRHELFNDVTFRHRHRHSTPYSDKFRHGADTVPTRPDMT